MRHCIIEDVMWILAYYKKYIIEFNGDAKHNLPSATSVSSTFVSPLLPWKHIEHSAAVAVFFITVRMVAVTACACCVCTCIGWIDLLIELSVNCKLR